MNSMNRGKVKLFAAVVGGSAVVAMGAIGVAVTQQSESQDVASAGATVNAVASTTAAPNGLAGATGIKAAPTITGVPALPSGVAPNNDPPIP